MKNGYDESLPTLLPLDAVAEESERAAGLHLLGIVSHENGKSYVSGRDWDTHWANVHVSAAYYLRRYEELKCSLEAQAEKTKVKCRPPIPPPGKQEWIEKGFPRYEKPNWWQKIMNYLFATTREE